MPVPEERGRDTVEEAFRKGRKVAELEREARRCTREICSRASISWRRRRLRLSVAAREMFRASNESTFCISMMAVSARTSLPLSLSLSLSLSLPLFFRRGCAPVRDCDRSRCAPLRFCEICEETRYRARARLYIFRVRILLSLAHGIFSRSRRVMF